MKNNTNIYKIGYQLVTSSDYNNPEQNIDKAIKVIKRVLHADTAVLLKKNKNNKFNIIAYTDDLYNKELKQIVDKYNKKRIRDLDIDLNNDVIKRLMILNIPVYDDIYSLVVTNGKRIQDNKESVNVLKKSFKNIIVNSELIYQLKLASTIDLLTLLKNRSCFEIDRKKIQKEDDKVITFIIGDLFRLKNINDRYGHEKGDLYISEIAHILNDTFNESKSNVYRIGGDEFAIISTDNNVEHINKKLKDVTDKVNNLDLKIGDEKIMFNFGVSVGKSHDFEELYKKADEQLSNNKSETYKTLKIDRRK